MKVLLYCNGSSQNHGCEAITRSVTSILKDEAIELYSTTPNLEAEEKFKTASLCKFHEIKLSGKYYLPEIIINKISRKITGKNLISPHYNKSFSKVYKDADVCVSLGGDNYCYGDGLWLVAINSELRKKNKKTVLFGCSIEESTTKLPEILNDLKQYDMILARESLTYEFLLKAGVDKNTYLIPDPAFVLEKSECELPENFIENNTVGLNVSPLVQTMQQGTDTVIKNYCKLVEYILDNTDMNVALIPHVIIDNNDDLVPLTELYNMYKHTDRVCLVNEDKSMNATELKYVISKCRFFVGARTHATIAAYSQHVPTLVLGYSVKAHGIAKDIFGKTEGYILPVQNLTDDFELTEAFKKIVENEENILKHYDLFMPSYIAKVKEAKKMFLNL